ncbi:MAG: hypothetical protein IPK74_11880 [Deltaproteobacteria bacterium]|nr:hypothetical protein [Deltaproteobacteria bacterium]
MLEAQFADALGDVPRRRAQGCSDAGAPRTTSTRALAGLGQVGRIAIEHRREVGQRALDHRQHAAELSTISNSVTSPRGVTA